MNRILGNIFLLVCLSFFSTSFASAEEGQYVEAGACIEAAGQIYNVEMQRCLALLGTAYQEGTISSEEYTIKAAQCTKGPLYEAFQRNMAVCYQSHSFGEIWDLPVMKQALTSQFKNFASLTSEQSLAIGQCVEGLQKQYDLQQPSAVVQRAIADCFAQGGLTGASDIYQKTAITLDCAEEKDVKTCVIERTAPAAAAIAIANIPLAVGFHNSFVFIQFLFTQPLFLLARRKISSTGTVFHSLTRQPLDLSIVRLIDTEKDAVINSMVTGQAGAYFFLPPPGAYRVEVDKQGFSFPSFLLKERVEKDFYFGESISVKTKDQVVDKQVPIDPQEEKISRGIFLWKKGKRVLVMFLAGIGPIVSLISSIIEPSMFTIGLFVLHIFILMIFFRLHRKKEIKYGTVYSPEKKPVSGVTVSLFSKQYNKLIAYYITDMFGRYFFPTAVGEFTVKAEKIGYITQEFSLSLNETSIQTGFIGKDIYLQTYI